MFLVNVPHLFFNLEKGIYFNIPASAWNYAYSCMLLHTSTSQAQRKEFQSQTQVQNHRKAILLLKDHPIEAKISIDVVSSTRQPTRMWGRSSSFCSNAQKRIQWVPRKITCRGVTARKLLKTMSFLLNQIVQHKADAPTKILYISSLLIPFNHPLNIWKMLTGGEILKETCTILQIILAIWQSKKRCWMVSSRLQKQHFILSLHCQRARLSLVRTTPFCKYQIKILIFNGSLNI